MKKIIIIAISFIICFSFRMKAQTVNDAILYLQQKNYAEALDACDKLLSESANDPAVLGVRSLVYTATGKYEQALQDADKALSTDNSGRAHYAKAEAVFYGQKDHNKALQEYDAAIDRKSTRLNSSH